jgi:hypothetical protein
LSKAAVMFVPLGAGFVSEVGSFVNVTGVPATGVALLLAFDWKLTVALKVAVKAAPPAGASAGPGTTNVGSPVELGMGAVLNVAIVGYAVGDGVGDIGTGVLWPAPLTLSVAPVT